MAKAQPASAELGWPTGDQPGDLNFQYKPSQAAQDTILSALSRVFPPAHSPHAALHALTPPEGVAGRYRLTTPEGAWFVRVSMWLGNAALEKLLVDYLASRNAPVNPLLVAGVTLEWTGRVYRVDVRPLIRGRHFNGSLDDLAQMAQTLAACHTALVRFPHAQDIFAAAAQRVQRLSGARDRIDEAVQTGDYHMFAEQGSWAVQHRQWLAQMVERFQPDTHQLPQAQCLHGQVHPGNVLFAEGGTAVLLDWEEAVYNYAPPAFDLAYFVQRSCHRDNPSHEILRQRLDTIAAHYGPLPPLAEMMRQQAWMSMAAIVNFQLQGIATPLSEYDKFVRLEQQARALIGIV